MAVQRIDHDDSAGRTNLDARRAVFASEAHIALYRGVFRAGLALDLEVVFGLYRVVNRRHELGARAYRAVRASDSAEFAAYTNLFVKLDVVVVKP